MRRLLCAVAATGLLLGVTGCGGSPQATPPETVLPWSDDVRPSVITPADKSEPTKPVNSGASASNIRSAAKAFGAGDAVRKVSKGASTGAVVFDRKAGVLLGTENASRPFRSASLVKLLIAIEVLTTRRDEGLRDSVATMLSLSDDPIASKLWTTYGGPALVLRASRRIGLGATRPPADPGQWGNTMLTASDVLRLYQYILTDAPAKDRELILNALARAPKSAADGFNQHFGIPSVMSGKRWAIKQGWSNDDDDISVHSTGLIGDDWRYIVVVLTEHPLRTPWAVGTSSVTAGVTMAGKLIG